MSPRKQFLDFVKRLDDLPARSEQMLIEFISDLKFTIKEIFGPDSQYLDYLKYVKFRPEAVFVTDRELRRCWYGGVAQVSNLLKVILHDPLVKTNSSADPLPSKDIVSNTHPHDVSLEEEADIRHSLGKLKQSLGDDLIAPVEEGPIKEPLRGDLSVDAQESIVEISAQEPKTLARVLLVPGSDQLINNEVAAFLRSLAVEVTMYSQSEEQAPLIDRLNRYAYSDFIVVIFSPDFYFYPRTQSHENASIMAPQEMVFQLGYLVAKLGRQKIVVLCQEHDRLRRPTDYFDLYYVSLNPMGSWKTDIVNRMKSSGVPVPENQLSR